MAKRIVIVGAGVVGLTCARRLSRDGYDVVVIERNPRTARELQDRLDVQVVTGNGASIAVLREANLQQASLLLAVTDSDELNLITALIAGTAFQVDAQVVRLRSEEYLDNLPELARHWPGRTYGISPDRVATDRIMAMLEVPHSIDVARLLGGNVIVAGFRVQAGCPLIGRSMAALKQQYPNTRILVAAIYRRDKALIPGGSAALEEGDIAYFSAVREQIPEAVKMMGYPFDPEHRVVVGGSGFIAQFVLRDVVKGKLRAAAIMRDADLAEKTAVNLPQCLVLQGEITSEDLLKEAGIGTDTSFIAASIDQESNLLASVLAKRLGAARVVTLVDNPTYVAVAEAMSVDAIVSPRLAAVSAILRFVRGVHFEEVASLPEEKVEVAVVDVDAASPLTGRPVKELGLPAGALITAAETPDGVWIPRGQDTLPPGSRAVIFVVAQAAKKLALWLEG